MGTGVKRCLIVSGAPEADIAYIKPLLPGAFVVAADSGYQKCRRLGAEPDIVVGDFDSSPVPEHTKELIVMPAHKDDTDTLAAIKIAMERGYTHLILVGAIGNRFDHSFSNVANLAYCLDRGVQAEIITPNEKLFISDGPFSFSGAGYGYFSLFAFGGVCRGLTIRGAEWELTDYDLHPATSMCQSNEVRGGECSISFREGRLLTVLSNDLQLRA